jgi:hypothetical protein
MSLSLSTLVAVLGPIELHAGTVDPSAAGGIVAPVGSYYFRSDATQWKKTGAAATAWTLAADLANTNPTTVQPDDAANPGVATTGSRSDHTHAIVADVAVTVTDATNAEGASTSFARADHTHSHGSRGGGTLHADSVSGGASGFMTGADKALLDTLVASSTAGIFGIGVDGDVVMGAGTTTLTRDMYYHDLTVPNGATLNTDGFRVFVSGTLTVGATGIITSPSNDAAAQLGAAQTTGNNLGLGGAGGNGGVSANGSNGAAMAPSLQPQPLPQVGATSGKGGVGGTGGVNTGGTGGAVNLAGATVGNVWAFPAFARGQFPGTNAAFGGYVAGGTGGGGGGGGGSTGGGGGAGGRVVLICARAIVNDGSITVPGGNGGPALAANGGGGAGGGGGKVFLIYRTFSGNAATAPGGNGGAGAGTGAQGGTGSTGYVATLQV